MAQANGQLFTSSRSSSRRAASFDRSGGNVDFVSVEPDETAILMSHDGPGCITHVYCAMILPDLRDLRAGILRFYWDGADIPSVYRRSPACSFRSTQAAGRRMD
jgi:hypothetical protein